MFGFFTTKRAMAALDAVAPTVLSGLSALPAAQRCAAMILAHAMLRAAAAKWGRAALSRPASLERKAAAEIVCELADAHAKLTAHLEAKQAAEPSDKGFAAALRQIRAAEVVMLTIGTGLSDKFSRDALAAWRAMWPSRRHAAEAVRLLRDYEELTGAPAVPPEAVEGLGSSEKALTTLATTLPPMFGRPRSGTKSRSRPA